jgi:hypothetical protein
MRRFTPIVTFLAGCVFTLALLARCSVPPANAGDAVAKTQVFSVACDQVAKDGDTQFHFAKVTPVGFVADSSVVSAMACDCVDENTGENCFRKNEPWQPEHIRCMALMPDNVRVSAESIYVRCSSETRRVTVSVVGAQ